MNSDNHNQCGSELGDDEGSWKWERRGEIFSVGNDERQRGHHISTRPRRATCWKIRTTLPANSVTLCFGCSGISSVPLGECSHASCPLEWNHNLLIHAHVATFSDILTPTIFFFCFPPQFRQPRASFSPPLILGRQVQFRGKLEKQSTGMSSYRDIHFMQ